MEELKNYIGGQLLPPSGGRWIDTFNPSTGQKYARVPASDSVDVEQAVHAAKAALPIWSALPSRDRAKILRKIAAGILDHLEEFALAESMDNGKPLSVARTLDIPRSALNLEFFADAITQFASESHLTEPGVVNYTLREPLGVVGCISPWNLPLYLFTWKIAPALAVGNTVVAKPSEVTPMTAYLFSKLCRDSGLPPGVLNVVHGLGPDVGGPLCSHPDVKAISFTGSTRTGAEIAKVAGPAFKKLSLEMGGKNPTIVFADCDFEDALNNTVRAAFSNQGQICLCGSRIYVERSIYSRFVQALINKTRELRVGDPLETTTQQGALVSREHYEKVLACIDHALKEGGKVLVGGRPVRVEGRCENGWFVEPTLIEGLPSDCRTNQEEIFGPVATVTPFDREEEVLAWANSTRYGLAASVWTQDLSRAHRFASKLQSGIVWINCWMLRDLRTPFGGTKDSGVGREGGLEALRFFTEPKNICLKVTL